MRLVLGAESLLGPLTGIGQYTLALAQAFRDHEAIESLTLFAHGRLLAADPLLDPPDSAGGADTAPPRQWIGRLRSVVARNATAVRLYGRVMPLIERRALAGFGAADVFHSPNYLLPPFPGRRVVSILDLSTCILPQFHPPARVELVNRSIERAIEGSDGLITISHRVRDEILERFAVAPGKVHVTHLAADTRFRPLSKTAYKAARTKTLPDAEALPPYRGYFLCSGSVEPRKNLARLLDAYEHYRNEVGAVHALPLLVTGTPGWKSRDIHERMRRLGERGAVRYLGYVTQEALPVLMAGARALLFPSLYEGFGLPALEAMQSGTPVLTSRGTAMEEVCGGAALLVDPVDTEAMAQALLRLASENAGAFNARVAGALKQARGYSWQRCADETLACYEMALRASTKPS